MKKEATTSVSNIEIICVWITEIISIISAMISFIYGIKNFFKKGKPLFMQSITLAMGCHALASIYHICQMLTTNSLVEGFTPAYLGKMGFFLFFITASYGQMDKIIDDGSPKMKKGRIIAIIAPVAALLLFVPNALVDDVPSSTKIAMFLVWIPATFAVYFNFKHSILPDLDFGFIKAIKPYNIFATLLGFSELLCLTAWNYFYSIPLVLSAVLFAVLSVTTVISAKKGAEKWTI